MTVTHGTRSAYNKGCRCDGCREASRLARARQRAAAVEPDASLESGIRSRGLWPLVVVLAIAGTGSALACRTIPNE
jgi:hypothetical protein